MSFNNSGFNQLFVNNQIKNEILELYDSNLGYVNNDYIDPALVATIEDVAVLQGQVADLALEVDTKEVKVQNSDASQSFNLTYGVSVSEPEQPALVITNPNFEYGYISASNIEAVNAVVASQLATFEDGTTSNVGIQITGTVIEMNEHRISNLNTLTVTSGAGSAGQVLGLDSSLNLVWKDDAEADVSQWATYPAVQNVDVDGHDVVNVNDLVLTNGSTSFTQSVENVGGIDVLQIMPSSTNKGLYLGSNMALFAPESLAQFKAASAGQMSITGSSGELLRVQSATEGDYSLIVDADSNTLVSQTNIECSGFGRFSSDSLNPSFKQAQMYYVSTNGSDSNSGSFEAPFLTIQHAVDVVEANFTGIPQVVNIAAGSYTENLTISKEKISLIGQDPLAQVKSTRLTGSITINIQTHTTDMFNSVVTLSGFVIGGSVLDSSDTAHCLVVNDCFIYANRALYQNTSSAVDCRSYIYNNIINAEDATGTDPLIEFANGLTTFTYNNCTAKGVQNVLSLSGISKTENISFNLLECSSSSASAPAIVNISTSQYSSPKSLAYNVLSYSSSTVKSNDAVSTGILMNTPALSASILYIFNNVFNLLGCPNTNKAVKSANAGSLITLYANNFSSSTNASSSAYQIDGTLNSTKFSLYAVV